MGPYDQYEIEAMVRAASAVDAMVTATEMHQQRPAARVRVWRVPGRTVLRRRVLVADMRPEAGA